jgi:signal transduction histidine kinase/ActR/RegA family two-component response regulator
MSLNGGTDRFGLARAIAARRRHLPVRLASAVIAAAGAHLTLGWELVWLWAAVFATVQVVEHRLSQFLPRIAGASPGLAAGLLCSMFALSSLVFGALAPALWIGGGQYGPAFGIIVVATAMTNLIAICRGSRLMFAVSALPYAAYLLAMPVMDAARVSGPLLASMLIAAGLVLLNVMGAWNATEEARRAQDMAQAEAELRRQEAEVATRAKSAYVAMISHELRTPISAILAGAAEAERAGHGLARLISEAGRMMTTLLDDMLDLSKLEAGHMPVESLAFDLRQTVADVVRLWRPQAAAKGLKLRIQGARSFPAWVTGDPMRMRQILNNLLSNALKFTQTGSVTLVLGGRAAPADPMLSITVDDTGPGMTPDQMASLFQPFEQLGPQTARQHGGTGLGLVISRELARLMGGDLVVDSAPGKGARFTLAVPLAEAAAPEAAPAAPPVLEGDLATPPRVLVVDDHAINRQAITLILAQAGITPETAASAETALERLTVEAFDLILMDVYMPDMDGREATGVLRSLAGPNRQTPVIAITASATARDCEACLAAGMNGHVAKPIQPEQLFEAMDQVLSAALEARQAAA